MLEQLSDKAPNEYLDPIMGHFMNNPVKLATSGVILDRVTILKHMMIDRTDPYNRQPLDYN
jgi:ubiquitin conjugation factor E4 B